MTNETRTNALTFHETTFDPIEHQPAEQWLRYRQIAEALGYTRQSNLLDLFNSNAAEFTPSMTALVKLPTSGGVQEVRIFSLRGAHLLGMFARTARAAEFRRWVLDVLDNQAAPPAAALPPPVAAEQVLATLQRVVAERDSLRALLAERMLKEQPNLRKVLYYYGVQGLTNTERATLMGWKTVTHFTDQLKKLAALGLVDYQPNAKLSANGMRSMAKINPLCGQGSTKRNKLLTTPGRMRPNNPGQPPELLHRVRPKPGSRGDSATEEGGAA